MIKSLYGRVILTFLGVVIVSLMVTFAFFSQIYKNQIVNLVEEEMTTLANETIDMFERRSASEVESFLQGVAHLGTYTVSIYSERGEVKAFYSSHDYNRGKQSKDGKEGLSLEIVEKVLQGEEYKSPSLLGEGPFLKAPLMLGVPVKVDEINYALFIKTNFKHNVAAFHTETSKILLVVLVIGSVLIVFVSRHLVKPLKMMTEATKKIAKGDFDVHIKLKQQDELGVLAKSFNQMAKELKQLETMRQDFVSNVSHEIQSPLTSIKGFTKALKDGVITDEDRNRYLDIISSESDRLSRLSDNLLKLASLDSEKHPFNPKNYGLDEQIRRMIVLTEPQWTKKNIDIKVSLPETQVYGDEDLLNQVWLNLLTNSIRYTPEGGEIRVEIEKEWEILEVKISDTGIGINPEDQNYIFQRFYKADKSRERRKSGSGLGLAIVKKIISMHQGEIKVESETNKGTIFIIRLPEKMVFPARIK